VGEFVRTNQRLAKPASRPRESGTGDLTPSLDLDIEEARTIEWQQFAWR
jgi:hypothetical protein